MNTKIRKNTKRVLAAFLAVVCLLLSIPITSSANTSQDDEFSFSSGNYTYKSPTQHDWYDFPCYPTIRDCKYLDYIKENPDIFDVYTDNDDRIFEYDNIYKRMNYSGKYDDSIVEIVPKELCFIPGYHLYFGKTYGFFIKVWYESNTKDINPFAGLFYSVEIMIFDIENTIPKVGQFAEENWGYMTVTPLYVHKYFTQQNGEEYLGIDSGDQRILIPWYACNVPMREENSSLSLTNVEFNIHIQNMNDPNPYDPEYNIVDDYQPFIILTQKRSTAHTKEEIEASTIKDICFDILDIAGDFACSYWPALKPIKEFCDEFFKYVGLAEDCIELIKPQPSPNDPSDVYVTTTYHTDATAQEDYYNKLIKTGTISFVSPDSNNCIKFATGESAIVRYLVTKRNRPQKGISIEEYEDKVRSFAVLTTISMDVVDIYNDENAVISGTGYYADCNISSINIPIARENQPVLISVDSHDTVVYGFTPKTSGKYTFYSDFDSDIADLYFSVRDIAISDVDKSNEYLAELDDKSTFYLEGQKTCYVVVNNASNQNTSGVITVSKELVASDSINLFHESDKNKITGAVGSSITYRYYAGFTGRHSINLTTYAGGNLRLMVVDDYGKRMSVKGAYSNVGSDEVEHYLFDLEKGKSYNVQIILTSNPRKATVHEFSVGASFCYDFLDYIYDSSSRLYRKENISLNPNCYAIYKFDIKKGYSYSFNIEDYYYSKSLGVYIINEEGTLLKKNNENANSVIYKYENSKVTIDATRVTEDNTYYIVVYNTLDASVKFKLNMVREYCTDKVKAISTNYSVNKIQTIGTYYIRNKETGKYLTVEGGTDKDFSKVGVSTFAGNDAQAWKLIWSCGSLIFMPACSENKSLDITNQEADIYTYDSLNKNNSFFLEGDKEEGYRISNVTSYLYAENTTADFVYVKTAKSVTQNDHWYFELIEYSKNTVYTSGTFYIKNKGTGKYLTVSSGKDQNFTCVGVNTLTGSNAQKWRIEYSDGVYHLFPLCSNTRALDVTKGATDIYTYKKSNGYNSFTIEGDMKLGCTIKNNGLNLQVNKTNSSWNYVYVNDKLTYNQWVFVPVN